MVKRSNVGDGVIERGDGRVDAHISRSKASETSSDASERTSCCVRCALRSLGGFRGVVAQLLKGVAPFLEGALQLLGVRNQADDKLSNFDCLGHASAPAQWRRSTPCLR